MFQRQHGDGRRGAGLLNRALCVGRRNTNSYPRRSTYHAHGLSIIDAKNYNLQEVYKASDVIYHLVNIDQVYIEIDIPETYIGQIREQMAVTVKFDALDGQEFPAVIDTILPSGTAENRIFVVKALVDNPDHRIKPGMFARVAVQFDRRDPQLTVAKNAVIYEDIPESRKVQFRQKIRRATRLIEATLANLDLLTMNRPFSRYFYPLRISMYLVTPSLFFAGGGIILIFLLAAHIWIGSLLLISLAACLVFIPNCIVSAFITNQFYLFLGLLRLGGDVRTWESTSRKAQN